MTSKSIVSLFRIHLFLLIIAVSSTLNAAAYSSLYIFGDSLSDTNIGMSNGALWPEYFSGMMGKPYEEGNNYAFVGAKTSDLEQQIVAYKADAVVVDQNALYVVWAGGNDIFDNVSPQDAADNLIDAISALSVFGAENFLVPNLPDLGLIPAGVAQGNAVSEALSAASSFFNFTIGNEYAASSNVQVVDVFGLHRSAYDDPGKYGFVNTRGSCLADSADCDTYFFWDGAHPTTVGHESLAGLFAATVVPVPAAVWLFGSGLLGVISFARRKRATV